MEPIRMSKAQALYVRQLWADGRSRHTIDQARRHLRMLARYLPEHRADEITHEDMAIFFNSGVATCKANGRAKKATSLNCLRSTLRTFFSYLQRAGFIERDPTRLLRLARAGVGPPRGISEWERERLFAAIAAEDSPKARRDEMLFGLMLATGIRISSALALDVEDLELDDGAIVLRKMKSGVPGRAYVPAEAMWKLGAFVGGRTTGAVFRGLGKERLGVRHAHRRLEEWCRAAGIHRRISAHSFRHTFALRLYERTGDMLVVQGALGHRSIVSSAVYARASGERVRAAVCASVLDQLRSAHSLDSRRPCL